MGSAMSKICKVISYPIAYTIRRHERKKTMKIYKEIFTDDIMDTQIGYRDEMM